VTTVGALLTAYDEHMRGVEPRLPAGVRYERDGPLLRVAGGHRGYISGPRDIGVTGAELDRLKMHVVAPGQPAWNGRS
jgi:hypothetical protein